MGDWVPNDGIDDDDGDEYSITYGGREATIYLIDVSKNINDLENSIGENQDQFAECLDCIEADLLRTILASPRDLAAVVFYNTLHTPAPNAILTEGEDFNTQVPENCAVFMPLKPFSKHFIQYFKNFRGSDDSFDFKKKYGSSTGSCLSEALWLCSRLLMRCNYKLTNSRIVLFTNTELPHLNGTKEQQQAFVRAKDLQDGNITVELVPMVDEFDVEPFYKEFLSTVLGIDEEQFVWHSPIDQRSAMLNRLHRFNYRKSCLRHLHFELAEGVSMSCDVFSLARQARKPNAVKMFRANNELVLSKRVYYIQNQLEEAGDGSELRKVLPSELYKGQQICGKEIIFKPDEIITMKSLQSPGIRLLGFKPLNALPERWMIKSCLFLYPSDKKVAGSTALFRALWQKCLEKQKYALCTLSMRRFTPPKYVALVPKTADADGNDGFCIIHLPMETNISVLERPELTQISLEQASLFERMVKKLRFKFKPQMFSNPSLQTFYANLEALVYDEEAKEFEDLSMPNYVMQDPKIEPFVTQIKEEFGTEVAVSKSRAKRPNDGEGSGGSAKIQRVELTMAEVEQALLNGQRAAVTVAKLKEFIKSKNAHAPSGATKDKLFDFAQKLID